MNESGNAVNFTFKFEKVKFSIQSDKFHEKIQSNYNLVGLKDCRASDAIAFGAVSAVEPN